MEPEKTTLTMPLLSNAQEIYNGTKYYIKTLETSKNFSPALKESKN